MSSNGTDPVKKARKILKSLNYDVNRALGRNKPSLKLANALNNAAIALDQESSVDTLWNAIHELNTEGLQIIIEKAQRFIEDTKKFNSDFDASIFDAEISVATSVGIDPAKRMISARAMMNHAYQISRELLVAKLVVEAQEMVAGKLSHRHPTVLAFNQALKALNTATDLKEKVRLAHELKDAAWKVKDNFYPSRLQVRQTA